MPENMARVSADVSLDTSDVEDVLEMIGLECGECGGALTHSVYIPGRARHAKRLPVHAQGTCQACGAEHVVPTGAEVDITFDASVEENDD